MEQTATKGNPVSQDELGISVLKSACSSEAKELAVEWAELGLDLILDDGILKDAPLFGTVVKICTISKTIRDRLFVRKVWGFLQGCPRFNEAERSTFVREHLDDPKKAQRLSAAIILIIDKLDDLDKPQLLAKIFAGLVRGKISSEDFRRLASALDIGFVEDLKMFSGRSPLTLVEMKGLFPKLVRTGLVDLLGPNVPGEGGMARMRLDASILGRQFQECVRQD